MVATLDLTTITATDFKNYFTRDFAYGTAPAKIADADITKALNQAIYYVNPAIFEDNTILEDAFLYCAAHYLVMDIRMAEAGLDSRGESIISSKSVGAVSITYDMPEDVKNSQFSYFWQTGYGQKYLSYIMPRLVGLIGIAPGWTTP